MTVKRIKNIGLTLSIIIGVIMVAVYVFSIVGLYSLIEQYENILLNGTEWTPSISIEDKLNIVQIYKVISYILIFCALALKIVAFILFKLKKKNDKHTAIALLVINGVSIVLKFVAIMIAIPAVAYLGYTDATMQVKFISNALFIAAQASIVVLVGLYLGKLSKEKKEFDNAECGMQNAELS